MSITYLQDRSAYTKEKADRPKGEDRSACFLLLVGYLILSDNNQLNATINKSMNTLNIFITHTIN